jgi:short-subunit dehydrogenase
VTGASAGIGVEIARALAGRGHGVTLVARREERLRELAEELGSAHGVRADVIAADLADAGSRDEMAEAVESAGRTVEILVNNAGFGVYTDFVETERERVLEMLRLNMEALTDLQARYLPAMVQRRRGTVINIASVASLHPLPGNAAYAATKSFVLSLGQSVHHELKGTGVTLTTVCPGPVRTEFTDVAGMHGADDTPDFLWSTPQDVAGAALQAAERGQRSVVPGALNRAIATVAHHSPRSIAIPLAERLFKIAE